MHRFVLQLFLLINLIHHATGQVSIEAQVGGANFMGMTVNSRLDIPLNQTGEHALSPAIGIGMMAPWWDRPTGIINAGITYKYKGWGIGTEVSAFDMPFVTEREPRDFTDIIIYPNFNYTFKIKSNWYLRLSAGPYFAFSRPSGAFVIEPELRFEGDVIPGAGIGFGYVIK